LHITKVEQTVDVADGTVYKVTNDALVVVPSVVVNVPAVTDVVTTKVKVVPVGTLAIDHAPFNLTCSVPVAPDMVIISPIA
jgi:hypothetical protein